MRTFRLRVFAAFGVFFLLGSLVARQDKQSPSVQSPVVSLRGKMSLADALREVRQKTGIAVSQSLGDRTPDIVLDLEKSSFWQAIDSISQSSKAKPVQSARDGSVTLLPMTEDDRRPPVSYDGAFRTRVVRITTSRDLDSDRASCQVAIDVTWTPTLRPLFLEGQVQKVRLLDENGKDVSVSSEGSSLAPVDGRFSHPLEMTLPALPRGHKKVGQLDGKLLAIAPTKMIRFDFDGNLQGLHESELGGEQRRVVLEKVECRMGKTVLGREAWSVLITLHYPEGNHKLESFQAGSIVLNNELLLTSKDGKRRLRPTNYVVEQAGSRTAKVTYHFADRPGALRGRAADWMVSYTAPARIVEVPFRFTFKDLPLP